MATTSPAMPGAWRNRLGERARYNARHKMKNNLHALAVCLLALAFSPDTSAHRIVACEPEWAALAKKVGGDLNTVYSATTGPQDPHQLGNHHIQNDPRNTWPLWLPGFRCSHHARGFNWWTAGLKRR